MQINKISLNNFENGTKNYRQSLSSNRFEKNSPVAFKGNIPAHLYDKSTDVLAKGLGKLANTSFVKKTVGFFNGQANNKVLKSIGNAINIKQKWFQHAVALEGIFVTSCYMYNTKKSKTIPEEQKKPMMTNQALVTAFCTTLAYTIDNKITKFFNKAKHVFTIANVTKIADQMKDKVAAAKKVAKTAGDIDNAVKLPLKTASGISNGISKLKSVLVFGFIYRYFSPVFITPIANRVSEYFDSKKNKNNTNKISIKK